MCWKSKKKNNLANMTNSTSWYLGGILMSSLFVSWHSAFIKNSKAIWYPRSEKSSRSLFSDWRNQMASEFLKDSTNSYDWQTNWKKVHKHSLMESWNFFWRPQLRNTYYIYIFSLFPFPSYFSFRVKDKESSLGFPQL